MAAEAVAYTFALSSSGEAALAADLIRRPKFRSSENFAGSRLEQEFEKVPLSGEAVLAAGVIRSSKPSLNCP